MKLQLKERGNSQLVTCGPMASGRMRLDVACMMTPNRIAPALSAAEWAEWHTYKAHLAGTSNDPARAAMVALQTIARNNELLPDDSPYKFTHLTVYDLHCAAQWLDREGHPEQGTATRLIASMLFASLAPA